MLDRFGVTSIGGVKDPRLRYENIGVQLNHFLIQGKWEDLKGVNMSQKFPLFDCM
jgi:hypothetical protein